jgi:hypothetical protein
MSKVFLLELLNASSVKYARDARSFFESNAPHLSNVILKGNSTK